MSAPPFDPNKLFVYMEDNGDGTSTQTMNFPEIGHQIVTVFPGNMKEIFNAGVKILEEGSEASQEMVDRIRDQAVDIPNQFDTNDGGN